MWGGRGVEGNRDLGDCDTQCYIDSGSLLQEDGSWTRKQLLALNQQLLHLCESCRIGPCDNLLLTVWTFRLVC